MKLFHLLIVVAVTQRYAFIKTVELYMRKGEFYCLQIWKDVRDLMTSKTERGKGGVRAQATVNNHVAVDTLGGFINRH